MAPAAAAEATVNSCSCCSPKDGVFEEKIGIVPRFILFGRSGGGRDEGIRPHEGRNERLFFWLSRLIRKNFRSQIYHCLFNDIITAAICHVFDCASCPHIKSVFFCIFQLSIKLQFLLLSTSILVSQSFSVGIPRHFAVYSTY